MRPGGGAGARLVSELHPLPSALFGGLATGIKVEGNIVAMPTPPGPMIILDMAEDDTGLTAAGINAMGGLCSRSSAPLEGSIE
mmetsp:Transcript_40922/g.123420  ORF Transcript_40922/g.123420 Transcript_40922/m.123420 type:complete len:83 (+) Transcript_40922:1064-1312(+)